MAMVATLESRILGAQPLQPRTMIVRPLKLTKVGAQKLQPRIMIVRPEAKNSGCPATAAKDSDFNDGGCPATTVNYPARATTADCSAKDIG